MSLPSPALVLAALAFAALPAAQEISPGLSPEAREVLDRLDSRIALAQAGQASRDRFLAALEGPEDGCGDWARLASLRRDPDLRDILDAVCPEAPRASRATSRRSSEEGRRAAQRSHPLELRLAASRSVRPADGADGVDVGPRFAAASQGRWGGLEAAATGESLGRRRAWLRSPVVGRQALGLKTLGLQVGHLRFRDLEADGFPAGSAPGPASAGPPALPRLDFVTGRGAFPGSGYRSGLEGPLETSSTALDGLGLAAEGQSWTVGGFATWNRRILPGGDAEGQRQDVSSASLAGGLALGPMAYAAQAAHLRLEPVEGGAGRIALAGSALGPRDGSWRLGGAASLRSQAAKHAAADPAPASAHTNPDLDLDPDPEAPTPGVYGEFHLAGADAAPGKPGHYLLELRQASRGWSAPLSAVPAMTRDTTVDGWILPGAGEGGLRMRSRLPIFGPGLSAALVPSGDVSWTLEGPWAGEGRLAAELVHGPWTWEAAQGYRWRREAGGTGGVSRSLSAHFKQGPWLLRISGAQRELADQGFAWPFGGEAAWTSREGQAWRLDIRSSDATRPARDWRLGFRQGWRLGRAVEWTHALRLPMEGARPGNEIALQVGLEGRWR